MSSDVESRLIAEVERLREAATCACGDMFNEKFRGVCPNCQAADAAKYTLAEESEIAASARAELAREVLKIIGEERLSPFPDTLRALRTRFKELGIEIDSETTEEEKTFAR